MTRNAFPFLLLATVSLAAVAAEAAELKITPVDAPNAKADGVAAANAISPELSQAVVAEGSMKLENPIGVNG